MEIEVQKFVSTNEISKERAEVREARERLLRDAERKAEARFVQTDLPLDLALGPPDDLTLVSFQVC